MGCDKMVSELTYPRQESVGIDWVGNPVSVKSPNLFRPVATDYGGVLQFQRQLHTVLQRRWDELRAQAFHRPAALPRLTRSPTRPYSLSGYGGGPDRCVVKVPDIDPGKIPKPASISGKMTKSMVRYEADASDPTAVWRVVHLRPSEEPRELSNQVPPAELEIEKTRRSEDLRRINLKSTQEIQPMGAPEGNLNSPLIDLSEVVATGWEQDLLPNDFGIPSWLFSPKDTDEGDFGIPSWLFRTPDYMAPEQWNHQKPSQEPALVRQWPLNPKEYLDQSQFKYQAKQWNSNPSSDRAPSFLKPLAKGPILDSLEKQMEQTTVKATTCTMEGHNADWKPHQILDMTDDEADFHMRQGALLYNFDAQMLHKGYHCFSKRLMLEYSKFSSLDSDEPFACKLNNPKHRDAYKQVNVLVLNYEAILWEKLPKFSMQQLYFVGLLWNLPPWPDLSFCKVYWMSMGMEMGVGTMSKRNAYDVVAGQSKNQFQPTRNKQLTDFVKEWVAMVEQFKLKDSKWSSDLYSCRKQWAPGYVNHSGRDGTSASRKVEKPDPYFDGAVEIGGVRLGQVRNLLGKITNEFKSCAWKSGVSNSTSQWPKVTQSDIQKYTKVFGDMDRDRDGKITGAEACTLFLSWRLPREVLKQVWVLPNQDNDVLPSKAYNVPSWQPNPGLPHKGPGAPGVPAGGMWPPLPPHLQSQTDGATRPGQPRSHIPGMVNHAASRASKDDKSGMNSAVQEEADAPKKVEVEKQIINSIEKLEYYRTKMQDLVLYKSRCDNRLNEITDWALKAQNILKSWLKGLTIAARSDKYIYSSGTASNECSSDLQGEDIKYESYALRSTSLNTVSTIDLQKPIDIAHQDIEYVDFKRHGAGEKCPTAIQNFEGDQTYNEKPGQDFVLTASFDSVEALSYDAIVIPGGQVPEYFALTKLKCVMQTWLLASNAQFEMIIFHFSFPSKAQKNRMEILYEGPLDDIYAIAIRNCDLEGKFATGIKVRILDPNYVPGRNQKKGLYVERVQRTEIWMGKKHESVEDVPCGTIVAMVGLDELITNNATLTNVKELGTQNSSEKLDSTYNSKLAAGGAPGLEELDDFSCPKEFDRTEGSEPAAVTHMDDFLDEHSNIRKSDKDALIMTSDTGSVKESIALQSKDSPKENYVPAEQEIHAGPIRTMKFFVSSVMRIAIQCRVISAPPRLVKSMKVPGRV